MAGVDNRIVTMKFDNRSFEQNARTSLTTLQKLRESMNFGAIASGAIRGLGAIESALSRIGLKTPFAPFIRGANAGLGIVGNTLDRLGMKNPFSSGVQGAAEMQRAAQAAGGPQGMGVLEGGVTAVSTKFLALSTIAITTLSNITNRAVNAGIAFGKSFTFAPVIDGLHEYETNLKSIQTVQANTDQPLDKVNASLDELNKYSDQTIYNFSEMAKNVGTFTAAGVDLETSVSAIKGIANLAALSGSSSEQAAGAMYQLSQAIASGKVSLMDWNSVVNAGMGGKKLQNALAQTAIAMGTLSEEQVKLVGPMETLQIKGQSFRESISAIGSGDAWLSSDVLVNTLATMDGRFSEAALAAERTEEGLQKYSKAQIAAKIATARTNLEQKNGVKFTDEQFAALQKMSTAAFKSATEVKTLGQVFDVAKETIASGWSASFRNIFGDLEEAKKLFTGMSNGLNEIINQNALARNTLLNTWKMEGGRDTVIEGLKNAWEALVGILGPIKKGFRDIFPAATADTLLSMSDAFRDLTERMIPSKATMKDLRDISAGVFSVFGIGKTIIVGIIDGFQALFGAIGGGNGNFLDLLANIGRSVTAFGDFLRESGVVTTFFESLGNLLAVPVSLLGAFGAAIGGVFGSFDEGKMGAVTGAVDGVSNSLGGLQGIAERVAGFLGRVAEVVGNVAKAIGEQLGNVGDLIANAFTAESFGQTLDLINTGLLGAITAMLINFFKGGAQIDFTGGLLSNIAGTLEEATGALTAMQTSLKADALMKIGISLAILAGSLLVLSTIDPADLRKALLAMTAGFGVLIGALAALMKFLGPVGLAQMYVVSTALTRLALSILILSLALKVLSGLKFGDMLRGLFTLGTMLFIIQKAMIPLAASSKGMARAAFSLILLGAAMNLMAIALKIFATMSWEEMAKGLAGLAGVLLALSIGLKAMPDLNAEAVTLIALGVAINILAVALKIFATMSWGEMVKGMAGLAGALLIIGGALRLMPKGILIQAVALNAVATAILILAGALKVLGSFSPEQIVKSLIMLGGALGILAIGLNLMKGALLGAAALVIAAAALNVLLPVLISFAAMSWESLLKSMTGLALVFVILGVAGYALAPVAPVLLALGAALLLFGAGLALAGAGALAAASAFALVVASGTAGAQLLVQILASLIAAIPPALKAFGEGIVQFAVAIGEGAPRIAQAFGRILNNILDQVIRAVPKFGRLVLTLINTGLKVLVSAIPRMVDAGLRIITGFLGAVARNIPQMADRATDVIVTFLQALGRNLPRIVDAGAKMIIQFVRGTAQAIRENSDEMGEAGADLGLAIAEGMARGVASAAGRIKDAVVSAGKGALNAGLEFFGVNSPSKLMRDEIGKPISEGIGVGVVDGTYMITDAIGAMGRVATRKMSDTLSGISDGVNMDPNFNPVVTPVLDLSKLTQDANRMSSIFATSPITPSVSYDAASSIAAQSQALREAVAETEAEGRVTYQEVHVEQHNHSPKPIDAVTTYRDTKSLISLTKEALKS